MPKEKATNPGLRGLKDVVVRQGRATGAEMDPALIKAQARDRASTEKMDGGVDVDAELRESMQQLEGELDLKPHPIGNGTTVPMPYEGEDTTDYTTCSKPIPGQNRGCMFAARKPVPCPLPALSKKLGGPGGPFNLVYKDTRSGLVKSCFCVEAMKNYLKQPQIVFLDIEQEVEGESFQLTRQAEFSKPPTQRQPRPPINLMAHKTRVVCVPPNGVIEEFQKMRRRGDFDRLPRRYSRERV